VLDFFCRLGGEYPGKILFSFGEARVGCRNCKSNRLHRFAGELTASSLKIENVSAEPVYVCQEVLVCVDCGFTELLIPPQELDRLRKISAAVHP
jgi:hypothetical protein